MVIGRIKSKVRKGSGGGYGVEAWGQRIRGGKKDFCVVGFCKRLERIEGAEVLYLFFCIEIFLFFGKQRLLGVCFLMGVLSRNS